MKNIFIKTNKFVNKKINIDKLNEHKFFIMELHNLFNENVYSSPPPKKILLNNINF